MLLRLENFFRVYVTQGWYLFLRDFQYRYKLTYLGYSWSVIRPIAATLPLVFIGKHFNFGSDDGHLPYEIYALTGIILWSLFWDSVTLPMTIFHRSRRILKKLAVSEISFAIAAIIMVLFNFAISLVLLFVVLLIFRVSVAPTLILTLLASPILVIGGLALGLPFTSVASIYHDLRYGVGFLGQFLLWCAPIVHELPEHGKLRIINLMNPLTYLIELMRNWIFFVKPLYPNYSLLSAVLVILAFGMGFKFYRRTIRLSYDYVL